MTDKAKSPTLAMNLTRLEPHAGEAQVRGHRPSDRAAGASTRRSTFETRSPVDKSLIAQVARGTADDVDRAAAAAKAAFKAWAALAADKRRALLHKIADAIEAHAEEIAVLECWDTGQPYRFMSKAAVRGAENFRFFADRAPDARDGLNLPTAEHWNVTTRVPIGPVGIITPWNTPFMLSTWKIAPALAAGCTVVHKPAEWSPVTADLLARLMREAGLPDGVLNTVHGIGEEAGKALTEHPDIKAIGFVGESATGSAIMRQGADTLKRVHFELGGKNPVIVFDDADLDRALDAVVFMIYSLNGERCTSSSRLLVQESIAEEFTPRDRRARRQAQGRPPARSGDRGRPADPRAPPRQGVLLLRHRPQGRRDHRRRRQPRTRVPAAATTCSRRCSPTPRSDMRIAQEEIFGPVLTVDPVQGRGRRAGDRQLRALRPDRLRLDQRRGPRAARRRRARSRHDLGQLRERAPPADAVRRRQGVRHRPRRRRLLVRLLHGNEEHLPRQGHARHPEARAR